MSSKGKELDGFDLKLYHMHRVRSTRVKWLLHELGVTDKVQIQEMDLRTGEQNKSGFRALNKMGAIPTLTVKEKDGEKSMVMTESSGICMWLTDMVPEGGLKPDRGNAFGLGQYYRFTTFAVSSMDPLLWDIRRHEQLLPQSMRVQQVADMARKEFLEKIIPSLEDVFKGNEEVEYICEPYHKGFTTADVMVGYALYWSIMHRLLDDSPILQEYLSRLTARKEFRASTEDMANL